MKEITSRDNRLVKLAVRLQQKKYRYEERRLIAEGFRIVEDAVHTGITDGICLVAAEAVERPELQNLQAESEKVGWEWYLLPDRIYEKVKETHSSLNILSKTCRKWQMNDLFYIWKPYRTREIWEPSCERLLLPM